ncbi:unnamed protein product, partial [Ascophyllum nodosum]
RTFRASTPLPPSPWVSTGKGDELAGKMAQGSFKKSAGVPRTKGKAGKANTAAKSKRLVNKGKTAVKKGSWVMPPKQQTRREAAKEETATTKMINSSIERQAAAKCFQNHEKLYLSDVKESGRELARDIKRKSLKRKKTRIEEKLEKAKSKVSRRQDK